MVNKKYMKNFKIILGNLVLTMSIGCSQETPEELFNQGNNFYNLKEYQKAIEYYDEAINKKNDYVEAYINKGQALDSERKFQEAIENYNTILELIPNEPQILTCRGVSLIKLQNFEDAIIDLEKSNKIKPGNAQTLSNLGLCKVRMKDASGIEYLNQALRIDSTDYQAYYNRGLGKLLILESLEAIKDFENSIIYRPGFGEAYFSIGIAKFQLGDLNEACEFWKLSVDYGYERAQMIIDQNCK
jgi:tetratricopeptide (TPR) repeat protein